nr:hypothetical protein CFP56_41512 [Quercus suber]
MGIPRISSLAEGEAEKTAFWRNNSSYPIVEEVFNCKLSDSRLWPAGWAFENVGIEQMIMPSRNENEYDSSSEM